MGHKQAAMCFLNFSLPLSDIVAFEDQVFLQTLRFWLPDNIHVNLQFGAGPHCSEQAICQISNRAFWSKEEEIECIKTELGALSL